MPNRPMRLTQGFGLLAALSLSLSALALDADNVQIDDPVVASTISEMQLDARGQAARTFYEYLSTGDEALLKKALAENFANCAVRPPCAPATIGLRPSRRLGASEKKSR